MKRAVAFGDPQSTTKLAVDALLAATSRWPGATSATVLPATAPGGAAPLVVTRFEYWEAQTLQTVGFARLRLLVWSDDADEAWDVASYLHGLLLASSGDADHSGYLYRTGPGRATDPDYGTPLSAFVVVAKMRAQPIAIA